MASTLPPLMQASTGAVASVLSNLLVYPLDTVTTRMQTAKGNTTLITSLRKMLNEGGIRSFYRGLASDSLSTGISQFIYFFCYSFLHKLVLKQKARRAGGKSAALSAVEGILVGCLSGIVAKGIVSPLSNVTVRQQTSSAPKAKAEGAPQKAGDDSSDDEDGDFAASPSITDILNDILREKGWTGLWSGFKSSIILTTNPAITFYVFELLKRSFIPLKNREHPSPLQTFLCGAFASSVASAITYPLILAKTRLQFKSPSGRRLYSSNADVFRKTIRRRGIRGMYAGLEGQISKGFLSEGVKLTIKDRLELIIVLAHRTIMQQKAAV